MVSRRFAGPSRTLTDRLRQRATPQTTRGALASRAQSILGNRGGADFSAVGRGFQDMMNHQAVAFGRDMTRSPAQDQIDATVGDVRSRLADAGIYKDELGTFQISGMERSDPSRAIRDAAIAAMDPTGEVARRVAFSEGQLNPEGAWPRPAPRGTNTAERAIPGISDVLTSRANEVAKPPDPSSFPTTSGGGTLPRQSPTGLPPGTLPRQLPGGAKPPQPTTSLPPGTLPRQGPPSDTKPPQPPNAVVPGSVGTLPGYPDPRTSTTPAAGGKPPENTGAIYGAQGKPPGPSGGVLPQQTSYMSQQRSDQIARDGFGPNPNAPARTVWRETPPGGYMTDRSTMATSAAPDPGLAPTVPNIQGNTPPGSRPPGWPDVIQDGLPGNRAKPPAPSPATQSTSAAPTTTVPGTLPRQGGPGTQTTPAGRPGQPGQTPSVPGQTTASRPGGAWPQQKLGPFGTDDGGSSMFPPGFPFNGRQMPGGAQGSLTDLSGLGASIQARVQEALGGNPVRQTPAAGVTPIPGLEGLGDRIRSVVEAGQQDMRARLAGLGMNGLPTPQPGGGITPPAGGGVTPAPGGPGQQTTPAPGGPGSVQPPGPTSGVPAPTGGASANALGVADMIILQESGGAPPTANNLNCDIRPSAGCLDLNTGIFQVTAEEYGLDWNRLVAGDAEYGRQAVAQLMTGYAQDDASKWNGPAGMTVWEYGEQNLPGGGWEAVGRVYFGGDVTGSFVDEQGRSGVTYGQQFIDKLNAAGIPTGPGTGAPGTTGPTDTTIGGPQTTSTGSTPEAQNMLNFAQQFIGTPYDWGAIPNPGDNITGFDCSGFTRYVAHSNGLTNLATGSEGQYEQAMASPKGVYGMEQAKPGDLVFWDTEWRGGGLCDGRTGSDPVGGCPNRASHVGFYLGNGKAIQAGSNGVEIVDVNSMYTVNGTPAQVLGFADPYSFGPPPPGYYA